MAEWRNGSAFPSYPVSGGRFPMRNDPLHRERFWVRVPAWSSFCIFCFCLCMRVSFLSSSGEITEYADGGKGWCSIGQVRGRWRARATSSPPSVFTGEVCFGSALFSLGVTFAGCFRALGPYLAICSFGCCAACSHENAFTIARSLR